MKKDSRVKQFNINSILEYYIKPVIMRIKVFLELNEKGYTRSMKLMQTICVVDSTANA